MARYVRRTYTYDEGGFEADGRVIKVLHHSPSQNRVTVLVEQDEGITFTGPGTANAEGVTDDETPAKLTFFCNTETGDGKQCTREVPEMGDACWQHDTGDE